MLVIDRKRIFLFRPKTNIRQENDAKYSPITNIGHKAVNMAKISICIRKTLVFLGWQLQVSVDGHDLWATETYMHKTLTMSTKS
jgi:hypothetical protein